MRVCCIDVDGLRPRGAAAPTPPERTRRRIEAIAPTTRAELDHAREEWMSTLPHTTVSRVSSHDSHSPVLYVEEAFVEWLRLERPKIRFQETGNRHPNG